MHIAFIEIQNFRKLKACRIELERDTTIFVGANNSGKTSAMDALLLFLRKSHRTKFATTDFTLSNWSELDEIGTRWVSSKEDEEVDLTIHRWLPFLPSIDIWLKAEEADIHRILSLLPTLDWKPDEKLGVRLVYAPKNMEQLYKDFRSSYLSARNVDKKSSPSLWPISMRDFLDRRRDRQFEVQSFLLDPSKCVDSISDSVQPQKIAIDSHPLDQNPFDGLIKIDVITAQRGFSDPKTEGASTGVAASLSTQLQAYFSKHLDPERQPDSSDIEVLEAIEAANSVFSEKMKLKLKPAIDELEGLNYPGFSDPRISVKSKIDPRDSLDHEAAIQFDLPGSNLLTLPEKYNGLGYQNLISMVFNLIRFRDEWMRVGKAAKISHTEDIPLERLHIVLVEEPEAHLHAQVQQVFIKKAYKVLRNSNVLKDESYHTQMIVSTHSSYIAHELEFSCLRYFRRNRDRNASDIPTATVINLSETFGSENETSKFAKRYLRTTHCDLFFADAAILVEGSAERMLIPHFVRSSKFDVLNRSYISLLEIGGAHAHRLRPLLETLGLLSLIITDLDSICMDKSNKAFPEQGKSLRSGNRTLKDWLPEKEKLDELLALTPEQKSTEDGYIRVAYQFPICVEFKENETQEKAIPYTFEDSLALTNIELFSEC